MFKNSRLSGKKVLAMLITLTVLGMAFMIIISVRFGGRETKEDTVFKAPAAGMSSVMEGYLVSNGESSVDMLATTAVAAGTGANRYYDEEGGNVGKLIVCTADDFAPVYLIKDDMSGMYGKIYKDSVATLISEDDGEWCKVVSGVVSGYVKASDFAFGEAAEALDSKTYVTTATIDSDELTLREEEDMTSVAKCILSPDAVYEVVEEDNGSGWTKLNVDGVGEGYVLSEYINLADTQKVGITVDQEYMVENTINNGVAEAEAREAMWTANRLAAEAAAEAERLATEEAIAEYNRLAAEAAALQAEYEAAYVEQMSAAALTEETYALMESDDTGYTEDVSYDGVSYEAVDTGEDTAFDFGADWADYSDLSETEADYGYDEGSDDWYYADWSDDEIVDYSEDTYVEDTYVEDTYVEDTYVEDTYVEDTYEEEYYEEEYYEEEYVEEEPYIDTAMDLRYQVVSYARSFCGWLPYVSGGHSLSSGADCSGFTSAIYAAFGYAITPSSIGQQYVGRSVSVAEALPGDIIIYNYGQHVAIYSGGGMKIHSPYPGEVVQENSIYTGTITDIRRIIE